MKNKTGEFEHPTLGEEMRAIGGGYTIEREEVLDLDGREVLYYVGTGTFDTSCCGFGGHGFAMVPGYLVERGAKKSDSGGPISLIEPIDDEAAMKALSERIKQKEQVAQVTFAGYLVKIKDE